MTDLTHGKTVVVTLNGSRLPLLAGRTVASLLPGEHTPCSGHGRCGKCRVTVEDAAAAEAAGVIDPPTADERACLRADEIAAGVRLACRLTVWGDVTVTTSSADHAPMAVLADGEISDIPADWVLAPAYAHYGVAVDIGTTTLAARLYDRAGACLATAVRGNPQTVFGADVVTRLEAAVKGRAATLSGLVRRALDGMLIELSESASLPPAAIDGGVLTGNMTMLCLLTGTDVEPLTHAPFACPRLFGETLTARDLGLTAPGEDTPFYLPPAVSAFVGADTVTAALAAGLCRREGSILLIDLGTNGEMLLSHGGRYLAASVAAGPAFEGVGISAGQTGRPGAIDRVWVENGRPAVHTIGDVLPTGLCGSGLVDALATLFSLGWMDETGRLLVADPAVIASPVTVTQADVRALQTAKAAVHAGIRTMLATAGMAEDAPLSLEIAGGFGRALDPYNAGKIGLLPPACVPKTRSIGNAALMGAVLALLYPAARREAATLVAAADVVELATSPLFAEELIRRMDLA